MSSVGRTGTPQRSPSGARAADDTGVRSWSPARIFLVAGGIVLLVLGSIGFLYNRDFPSGVEAARAADSAFIFGVLETNGWHNLAGLVTGGLMLLLALRPETSRPGALLIGAFHVAVTTSLFVWDPQTLLLASNMADQVVHSAYAIAGIATGLATSGPARRISRSAVAHGS